MALQFGQIGRSINPSGRPIVLKGAILFLAEKAWPNTSPGDGDRWPQNRDHLSDGTETVFCVILTRVCWGHTGAVDLGERAARLLWRPRGSPSCDNRPRSAERFPNPKRVQQLDFRRPTAKRV